MEEEYSLFQRGIERIPWQGKRENMPLRNIGAGLLIFGVLISQINGTVNEPANHNKSSNSTTEAPHHEDPPALKVAKFDFDYVRGPLTIILWILLASLAKLGKV